jgi:hypothetical protein
MKQRFFEKILHFGDFRLNWLENGGFMKRIFSVFIVCLIFQIGVSAQQSQTGNSPCPKISVTVSPEVINVLPAGDPLVYTASLENLPENSKIEYHWEVSAGRIVSGQGTPVIEVDVKDLNQNVTATVEIKGLPENCPNTVSETPAIAAGIVDNCLGGYGKVSRFAELVHLDNETIQLRQNPNLSIVFRLKFKGKPTSKQIDLRIARTVRQFAFRKALHNLDRVAFVIVEDKDEEYTTICYFPKGKEETYCDDCKIIKGAELDLSKFSKSKKPRR